MTLRFFRRKSASSRTGSDEPADESQDSKRRSTRGRRGSTTSSSEKTSGGGRSSSRKSSASSGSTAKSSTSASSGTTSSRTRRGRRGGARRTKSKTASEERTTAEKAPEAPPPEQTEKVEELVSRQEAVLELLSEQQLTALKGVQGSLSAIENRLAGMGRLTRQTEGERVGVFVDVPNIMYAAERLRVKLDYEKMLSFLVRGRELVRASAYAPISDDPQERLETQRFVQPFAGHGYRLVTKPLKRYADGSIKANFDVELAIDVLTMSDRLDIVTLVSGDGDFRRLVELVASKGVRVEVVAFGQSTAAELRAIADEYTDLNDYIAELRVAK